MLQNIKSMMFIFVFALLLANMNVSSEASISTTTNLWGNKDSKVFHKLVSKELLSFGKSDSSTTTKKELLKRAKILKESLGDFVNALKETDDTHKSDHPNNRKHEKKEESGAFVASPDVPVALVDPLVPAVVASAPAVAPLVAPASSGLPSVSLTVSPAQEIVSSVVLPVPTPVHIEPSGVPLVPPVVASVVPVVVPPPPSAV